MGYTPSFDMNSQSNYLPFQHLPNAAKCAIEYLDAQGCGQRSIAKLDRFIDHYFKANGQKCDEHTRASCHYIAMTRYSLQGEDAAGATCELLAAGQG